MKQSMRRTLIFLGVVMGVGTVIKAKWVTVGQARINTVYSKGQRSLRIVAKPLNGGQYVAIQLWDTNLGPKSLTFVPTGAKPKDFEGKPVTRFEFITNLYDTSGAPIQEVGEHMISINKSDKVFQQSFSTPAERLEAYKNVSNRRDMGLDITSFVGAVLLNWGETPDRVLEELNELALLLA